MRAIVMLLVVLLSGCAVHHGRVYYWKPPGIRLTHSKWVAVKHGHSKRAPVKRDHGTKQSKHESVRPDTLYPPSPPGDPQLPNPYPPFPRIEAENGPAGPHPSPASAH